MRMTPRVQLCMGFDRNVMPKDRDRPERPPWTSWLVLVVIVVVIAAGLIIFL